MIGNCIRCHLQRSLCQHICAVILNPDRKLSSHSIWADIPCHGKAGIVNLRHTRMIYIKTASRAPIIYLCVGIVKQKTCILITYAWVWFHNDCYKINIVSLCSCHKRRLGKTCVARLSGINTLTFKLTWNHLMTTCHISLRCIRCFRNCVCFRRKNFLCRRIF